MAKEKKGRKSKLPRKKSGITNRTKTIFATAFLFLTIFVTWHVNQTIQLMFFTPKVTLVTKTHPIPNHITISKVDIDLPIEETNINNGIWQISDTGASHLTISARPGEQGPIILYGHNTNDRFGPIRWLSKGDTIDIQTLDGKTYTYTISQTLKVSPNKMNILNQKGETLILYTCDGFADLERFVVIAKRNK